MSIDKVSVCEVQPKLVETLKNSAGFTDADVEHFISYMERKLIRKKEFILRAGDICRHHSFINKGCMRRYVADNNGKETIIQFGIEDWWLGDLESLEYKRPTIYYIQALEDTEILRLERISFLRIMEEIPKFKIYHESKVSNSHFATLKRLSVAQSGSPEEKYQLLMQDQPELFQRIPLHYIASYLGIEPESLSRLRKRMAEKAKNLNQSQ